MTLMQNPGLRRKSPGNRTVTLTPSGSIYQGPRHESPPLTPSFSDRQIEAVESGIVGGKPPPPSVTYSLWSVDPHRLLTDDAAFQWHATLINTRYRAENSEVPTAGKEAHSSPPARFRRVSFDASSLLDGSGGLRSFDFGLAHIPGVHLSRRFPAPAGDAYYQHEALAPLP